MNKPLVFLVHQDVNIDSSLDELDVLDEVKAVSDCLTELGYDFEAVPLSIDFKKFIDYINKKKPDIIFNLVESLMGKGKLNYISASIIEALNVPFTGNTSSVLYMTTDKLITKEMLHSKKLPTPSWVSEDYTEMFKPNTRYIIKPVDEDASVGITQESIVMVNTVEELLFNIHAKKQQYGATFYADEFIVGREFNISVIGKTNEGIVMPPAEIIFSDFSERNLYEIVDYSAKWDTESFNYKNTNRSFKYKESDSEILDNLTKISLKCWNDFKLKGYARIDFRVDQQCNPYIIEINANPCISHDSGFVAACSEANMTLSSVVDTIIKSV